VIDVHAKGFRYRVDIPPRPGMKRRADLVFSKSKLAVFIDGWFWHSCPSRGTQPRSNRDW
jgi:DNA mismatch endonuclease (patch repair protein)